MITFAFCTYKRPDRLGALIAAMRLQTSPEPFEILAINNNSPDNTLSILDQLARQPGASLRVVTEMTPGIVAARNRALAEAMQSDILVFIDDDELPRPGLIAAASDAIRNEGALCVGGRVKVNFEHFPRPGWLGDELLGFLAEVDYGSEAFWITDDTTPIWTANVGYDMQLFRDDPGLRFDTRFDRKGAVVGGGSDAVMFQTLLEQRTSMRYRPEMVVDHFVEAWRLSRKYFLKLHFRSGIRQGRFELPTYRREVFGIPPFLLSQAINQGIRTAWHGLTGKPGLLRQAMNLSHAIGQIVGYRQRNE